MNIPNMETESSANKIHILVLPFPAQGHINPLLQFCKRLVHTGKIKATFATSVFLSKSIVADPGSKISLDTISDGHDEGGRAQAESDESYLSIFETVGSKTLTRLLEKLKESSRPVDCLIYDSFMPWALDVGRGFGVVTAAFFTQSCAVTSIYYHAYKGKIELPLKQSSVEIEKMPVMEVCDLPSFIQDYGSYTGSRDMLINQFCNIQEADWVFFNIFFELEKELVEWLAKLWNVRTIGPTMPSMYLDTRIEDDKDYGLNIFSSNSSICINWLNTKPKDSVIYVSFGSMAELNAEQMEELAWALINTNYNFMWVVRGTEESKLPKKFVDGIDAEKCLITKWCPQLAVLSHESVKCFVTHCGFNSVLEAIGLGVAMVGVPQWSDQTTNAKYVEDVWKMGIRVKVDEKGIARREELEKCVKEVMDGERGKEISINSTKWKDLAREAVDEGGSSDKNIVEFVHSLTGENGKVIRINSTNGKDLAREVVDKDASLDKNTIKIVEKISKCCSNGKRVEEIMI